MRNLQEKLEKNTWPSLPLKLKCADNSFTNICSALTSNYIIKITLFLSFISSFLISYSLLHLWEWHVPTAIFEFMINRSIHQVVYQRTAGPLGPVLKKFKRTGPFRTTKLPKGPLRTSFLIKELLSGFQNGFLRILTTSLFNPPNPWLSYISLNFIGPLGLQFCF